MRNQANALTEWRPTFVGAIKVESSIARDSDIIPFDDTPAGRRAFLRLRLTGRSPRLRGVLAKLRPAVIHAHFGGDGWLVSRSAQQLGIPLVVTLHGHDVTRQPNAPGVRGIRYRRNLRTMFDRATVILAVSEFIRDRAIAVGADPAKVVVHHTGVAIPPEPEPVPKKWDVMFVGRFVEKKGVDDLVEAVALLREQRPSVASAATRRGLSPKVLFIGAGPLEDGVRARAAALGLDATFLGAQEPAVVARCMTESRIFVSPSKTASDGDAEGLPTTILEAASLGLPVVSTRHSGIPEAVLHGETGLLSDERDPAALAANIEQLLGDEAMRTRLGAQARRHIVDNFDLRKQTRILEERYAAAADGVPAGQATSRTGSGVSPRH